MKTLGFNRTITLVLTCPPFLFATATSLLIGWNSGRVHERTWHITCGFIVAIIGFVIAASNLTTAGRYTACFIFPAGSYSVNSVLIGWASSTLGQTKEKKAVCWPPSCGTIKRCWYHQMQVGLAIMNVGGQIGYIYGAYLWPKSDEPRYGIGFGASAGHALCAIACAWTIRHMLVQENKKIRESATEAINLHGYWISSALRDVIDLQG